MGVDVNTDVNLVVMVGRSENVTTIKREIYKSKKLHLIPIHYYLLPQNPRGILVKSEK